MVWLTRIFGALKNEINNKYGLNSLSLPFEMSNEFPRCMSHQVLYRQKWVEVGISKYLDQEGRERNWDVVSRTTSKSGVLGAVDIIAIVLNRAELRGVEKQILLVSQFRPPICAESLEFCSGLIEQDETPQEAALRELKEETGFFGKICHVSPKSSYEPGILSEFSVVVHVEIDLKENRSPKQELDEDEFVKPVLFPKENFLQEVLKYQREKGCILDRAVLCFGLGLSNSF